MRRIFLKTILQLEELGVRPVGAVQEEAAELEGLEGFAERMDMLQIRRKVIKCVTVKHIGIIMGERAIMEIVVPLEHQAWEGVKEAVREAL
jgi:hypothetical protein